jgi:hypothetical protein
MVKTTPARHEETPITSSAVEHWLGSDGLVQCRFVAARLRALHFLSLAVSQTLAGMAETLEGNQPNMLRRQGTRTPAGDEKQETENHD